MLQNIKIGIYILVDTMYCFRHIYLRLSGCVLGCSPKCRAVAMDFGEPRKSVAQEWKKDLFRFLPVGQGDIKCQHVYSSKNKIAPQIS